MKKIITLSKDFLLTFYKPHLIEKEKPRLLNFIFYIVLLVFLTIFSFVITILFATFFTKVLNIPFQINQMTDFDKGQMPFIKLIIIGAIIAPILEELSFRLPTKIKYQNFIIAIISYIILITFFTKSVILYQIFDVNYLLISILIFLMIIIVFLRNKIKLSEKNSNYIQLITIYLLAFYFTYGHAVQPFENFSTILFSFIANFSMFFAALFFTYIRLKNGIFWGILFHIIHNLFPMLFQLIIDN